MGWTGTEPIQRWHASCCKTTRERGGGGTRDVSANNHTTMHPNDQNHTHTHTHTHTLTAAMLLRPLIGFLFWDVHAVALGARRVCAVTHADPRCAASCVAVAVAVAMMLRDRRFAETADGMVEMIETATTLALAVRYLSVKRERLCA